MPQAGKRAPLPASSSGPMEAHSQPAAVAPSPPGHTRTTSDTPPHITRSPRTILHRRTGWECPLSLRGDHLSGECGWRRGEMMMNNEFPSGFHSGRSGAPDRFQNPTEWLRMHSPLSLPGAAASDPHSAPPVPQSMRACASGPRQRPPLPPPPTTCKPTTAVVRVHA